MSLLKPPCKQPCAECPFRVGGKVIKASHRRSIVRYRGPFPCHQTVRYVAPRRWRNDGKGRACAGYLAARTDDAAIKVARHFGWAANQ